MKLYLSLMKLIEVTAEQQTLERQIGRLCLILSFENSLNVAPGVLSFRLEMP